MNLFIVICVCEGNTEIVSAHRMKENAELAAFRETTKIDERRRKVGLLVLAWRKLHMRWTAGDDLSVEVIAVRVMP